MPVTVGNLIGKIIGAGEGEIVMQQNVSICQQIVLSCFDWTKKRNKIVSEGDEFPVEYVQLRASRCSVCHSSLDGWDHDSAGCDARRDR